MAEAMVQRTCAKLRSAIRDGAAKRWNLAVGDLEDAAKKMLEGIQAAVEGAESQSLNLRYTGCYVVDEKVVYKFTKLFGKPWMINQATAEQRWLARVSYNMEDVVDGLQLQSTTTVAAGKMTSRMLPGLALKKNRVAKKVKDIKEELGKMKETMRSKDAESFIQRIARIHADVGAGRYKLDEAFTNRLRFMHMALCYASMPPSMRLCFAYCAVLFFPADRGVAKDDMVCQWIALDLVQPSGECSATQVAEEYIRSLTEMFFLQGTKLPSEPASGKYDKGAVLFTMPDQARNMAKYLMFGELIVLDGKSLRTEEYCRHTVLTDTGVKPSSVLPAQLRVLRCMGCSKMELSDDSFSFARCLRILDLKESSMQKLPGFICGLKHLGYLNLSSCSRLFTLPESFGYLVNLLYIDLSGCSGLVKLPHSFGKLINLMHVTFSGCSGLANLPESFGDLTKLLHVDMSRCYGLVNLPKSFQNLTSLMHLDLSFCSCLEEIQTVLGGLTSLQHLNLSHPCCYLAQHRSHLQGLKDVMGKLTKLQYLNLSMFLNPIFYYQSENENHKYIQLCISSLRSLEHLDLSHNIFLSYLPVNQGKLSNLHTLDLSGCIRLKKIYGWMGEIECLKLNKCRDLESCLFVVRSDDRSSSLVQLEHVNCQELEIRCLEKVKSTDEAKIIRLAEKRKVQRLKLCWTMCSQGSVEDNALLEELQWPHNLQCLELHGYNGETCLPAWWWTLACHLLHLVELTMEDFPKCRSIPPLGILPNLQRLILRRMASVTSIDAGDLSRGNTAFGPFSKFIIDDMGSLEELVIFPSIDELVIELSQVELWTLPTKSSHVAGISL